MVPTPKLERGKPFKPQTAGPTNTEGEEGKKNGNQGHNGLWKGKKHAHTGTLGGGLTKK